MKRFNVKIYVQKWGKNLKKSSAPHRQTCFILFKSLICYLPISCVYIRHPVHSRTLPSLPPSYYPHLPLPFRKLFFTFMPTALVFVIVVLLPTKLNQGSAIGHMFGDTHHSLMGPTRRSPSSKTVSMTNNSAEIGMAPQGQSPSVNDC